MAKVIIVVVILFLPVIFLPVNSNHPTPTATSVSPTATTIAATATATSTPAPVGPSGNWNLIFSDEFGGTTFNSATWATCYPDDPVQWDDDPDPNVCDLSYSPEAQRYLPQNAFLDGSGHLVLRAKKEMIGKHHYTSGMIQSYDSFNFRYGYAESRFKIAAGRGFWPAFWMLPVNEGVWPQDEIDIMENLGQDPNTVYMTYHWPTSSGTKLESFDYTGPNFSTNWHTFGVDWRSDAIIWYIDGVERARYTNSANITRNSMFIILDFAIGVDDPDSWPGPPDDSTPFPSDFTVDYIRVWQRAP